MKKILGLILLSFFATLSAWAMTPLPDESLSCVTGQAGVSINPDVTLTIGIDSAAWGDADGIGSLTSYGWNAGTTGGYVGVRNFSLNNLRMKSRETDTFGGYDTSQWKPITIDVATDPLTYGGSTFVRLGEGAMQITWDSLSLDAVTGPAGNNLNQKLGEVYLGSLALYLNPLSYIDIYNDRGTGVGVNLAWNTLADRIDLSAVSWGDSDGLPGGLIGDGVTWMAPGGSPGYVGLSGIHIDTSGLKGTFTIDVNTSTTGVYSAMNGGPVSVVHVGFPTDFLVFAGRFTAEVRTDNTPQLVSPNAGVLGNLFIDDLNITILNGSWVDIWAH